MEGLPVPRRALAKPKRIDYDKEFEQGLEIIISGLTPALDART
jgi:hypothetical protein